MSNNSILLQQHKPGLFGNLHSVVSNLVHSVCSDRVPGSAAALLEPRDSTQWFPAVSRAGLSPRRWVPLSQGARLHLSLGHSGCLGNQEAPSQHSGHLPVTQINLGARPVCAVGTGMAGTSFPGLILHPPGAATGCCELQPLGTSSGSSNLRSVLTFVHP